MSKASPIMAPPPASLASALASAGLHVQLAVTREDGHPLSESDREAVEAIVACMDLENGQAVTDEEAAKAASYALAAPPKKGAFADLFEAEQKQVEQAMKKIVTKAVPGRGIAAPGKATKPTVIKPTVIKRKLFSTNKTLKSGPAVTAKSSRSVRG